MGDSERVEALEAALRACSMFLIVVEVNRRRSFLHWTAETTELLGNVRSIVQAALKPPERSRHVEPGDVMKPRQP